MPGSAPPPKSCYMIELITLFIKDGAIIFMANSGQIHQPEAIITTLQTKADLAANAFHKQLTLTSNLASQIATAEKNISVQRHSEPQIAAALKIH